MSLQALPGRVSPEPTRTTADSITSARLGEIWPAASRRLLRVLELRGLDRQSAEDVVQEVGARAIQYGVTFDGLDDFLWWATPVARNLHIDLIRASKWSVTASELPEREAPTENVEHVVERRLALQSVLEHLSTMSPADREAIVAAATDAPVDEARRGTVAVRRHRARASLRRVVGTALGLSGMGAFLRRLRASGAAAAPMTAVALAMPALVYTVSALPAPSVAVPSGRAHVVTVERAAPAAPRPAAAGVAARPAGSVARPAAAPLAKAGAPGTGGSGAIIRPTEPKQVVVKPVDDNGAGVETRPSDDNDKLACFYGGRLLGLRCVDRPERPQFTVNTNDLPAS